MNVSRTYRRRNFKVFNAMPFTGQPTVTGMRPIYNVTESSVWGNENRQELPSAEKLQNSFNTIMTAGHTSGPLILDFEQWTPHTVEDHRNKLIYLIQQYQGFNPNWQVGVYGICPERDIYAPQTWPTSPEYATWQARNLAVKPIATAAQVLFPTLYTLYPDVDRWKRYATAVCHEARNYWPKKPVYPLLWPKYHNKMTPPYALEYMDPEFWYEQLMTIYRMADGVVIWSNWESPNVAWSQELPFMEATQLFLQRYGEGSGPTWPA